MPAVLQQVPGFVVGGVASALVFFLLLLLLQAFASFPQGSVLRALAEQAAAYGPVLPWILAVVASAVGAAVALALR